MKPQVTCRVCGKFSTFGNIYTVVEFDDRFFSSLSKNEAWICSDCYNWFMNMKSNLWEIQNKDNKQTAELKRLRKKLREARNK